MRRRSRPGPRLRISRPLLVRLAAALLFVVVAGWFVIAVSGAAIFRISNPPLAMRLFPADARAAAAHAEQLTRTATPTSRGLFEQARRLSSRALQRDATVVPAWRTLGLVAGMRNRERQSAWFFRLSERLSRRDLFTQIWLIEQKVRENDIRGALMHYDAALRTSPGSYGLLIPVLVSASSEVRIVRELAPYLAANPPWARAYYVRLIQQPPPGDGVAILFETMRRHGPLPEQDLTGAMVTTLAGRRDFAGARRVYAALVGRAAPFVTNGSFEQPNRFPPVDWQAETATALGSEARPIAGAQGALALHVYARTENSGVAARQMLALAPGRYELRSLVGRGEAQPPASLRWRIVCGTEAATELLQQDITPRSPQARSHRAEFQVPRSCPGQWILLDIDAGETPSAVDAWVDNVVVVPVGASE